MYLVIPLVHMQLLYIPATPQGHQVCQRAGEERGWGVCPGRPGTGPDTGPLCGLQAAGQ